MSKPTPGPWRLDNSYDRLRERDIVGLLPCYVLAAMPEHSITAEEREANARLIAASPDLLESLNLAPNVNDYGSADAFFEDYDRWWRGRCEAIKEATEAQ